MNKVILMGRLTRDPDVRYSNNSEQPMAVSRFSLAVDRRFSRGSKDGNEQTADFINCVAFGKTGEFVEKYLHKGTKIALTGRIQTGSYTDKDGKKVYTTDVVAEDVEFAESKNASQSGGNSNFGGDNGLGGYQGAPAGAADDFMNIPEGVEEEMPFSRRS